MPKVSVIIPNYNHAAYLRRRIDSVLNQTLDDFEVVLMDDASTDDSRSVLAEYADDPRVRLVLNDENSGCVFRQWDKGISLSQGEFIWIAESDDLADERLLERVVGLMETDPDCGVGMAASWLLYGSGEPNSENLQPHGRHAHREAHWSRDFVEDGKRICAHDLLMDNALPNASAVVFRKSLYEAVGGADQTMTLCGDWDLWARMLLRSKLAHVADRLNYYRCHDASVRSTHCSTPRTFIEVFDIMGKILREVDAPEAARERALNWRARLYVQAAQAQRFDRASRREIIEQWRQVDPQADRRLAYHWCRWRAHQIRRWLVFAKPRGQWQRAQAQMKGACS